MDHVKPIIEVRPKHVLFYKRQERTIARCNDPYIQTTFFIGAHSADDTSLQNVQKFGLQGKGQVVYVVEKQCALMRTMEKAFPVPNRPGKCAAAVSEQFASAKLS